MRTDKETKRLLEPLFELIVDIEKLIKRGENFLNEDPFLSITLEAKNKLFSLLELPIDTTLIEQCYQDDYGVEIIPFQLWKFSDEDIYEAFDETIKNGGGLVVFIKALKKIEYRWKIKFAQIRQEQIKAGIIKK